MYRAQQPCRLAALATLTALACTACGVAPRPPSPDRPRNLFDGFQDAAPAEPPRSAKEGPKFDTFSLAVGGQLVSDFSTTLRLDSERLGRGTSIGLEDDLGFDSTAEFARFDAAWRFNRNHAVEVSYYDFSRTATRRLERTITWGDRVFEIDTAVVALFESKILRASYRYTMFGGENWELGAALGVHGTWLKSGIGIAGTQLSASEDFDVLVPLPVLGLRGTWELGDDFRFRASSDIFYLALDGIDEVKDAEGLLLDVVLTAEYDLTEFLAVGLGGNYFRIDAEYGSDRLRLSAEYDYFGGLFFGRLSF